MAKYNTRRANKKLSRTVSVSKDASSNVTGPADEISTSLETNKKRKASKALGENQKEIKRCKKTDGNHDNYCWKCHSEDAEIYCSTCIRAFHYDCVKASKINKDGSCYVCMQQSAAKTTFNIDDEVQLSKLLLHIINTACPLDKEEYMPIIDWPDSEENEQIFCKKDFRLIYDKCIQSVNQYESPTELVDDVEWILHNCIIIYGDKSSIVKSAKKVLKCINHELNDAVDCLECYFKKIGNEPLTFLHICKKPHPLVSAKVKGYPYWPAKCLKVSNEKARVRFFGTHQIGNPQLSDVVSMSEECPSNSSRVDLKMAMAERDAYIDIFRDNFGSFPYMPVKEKVKKVNSTYDFVKEENFLMDLVEKHSRRRIIPEDSFPLSSVNESDIHSRSRIIRDGFPLSSFNKSDSRLAVVDLTDDASEDDEDQLSDHTPPMHETGDLLGEDQLSVHTPPMHETGDLLGEDHLSDHTPPMHETGDLLEEALVTPSNDANNIYAGLEDAKSLLFEESSSTGISISNVISGPDVSADPPTDLFDAHYEAEPRTQNSFVLRMPPAESDPFQSSSVFSQNNFLSSNSMQFCIRNFERASERTSFNTYPNDDGDIEIIDEVSPSSNRTRRDKIDKHCILQAILRRDQNSYTMLKLTNALVQDLFIHLWGNGSKLNNPEKIVQTQENEIIALKAQLDEVTKEVSLIKERYELLEKDHQEKISLIEEYNERIQNADKLLKNFRNEAEKLKKETEKLKKELERKSEMIDKNIHIEKLKEAKTIKYCNYCLENQAIILCCYKGVKSFAYCSRECKGKDNLHKCKSSDSSKSEERDDPKSGQVAIERGIVQQSTTLIYSSTVETRSVQSHISSKEKTSLSTPQQSSSANVKINKVVSSKKTLEVARNINRNNNSPDIY